MTSLKTALVSGVFNCGKTSDEKGTRFTVRDQQPKMGGLLTSLTVYSTVSILSVKEIPINLVNTRSSGTFVDIRVKTDPRVT